jgi:hypothetical protein
MSVGGWVFRRPRLSSHVGGIQRLLASGFGRWSGATLLFSVAAVVQTWPLVLHAGDRIDDHFGQPFDSWFTLWSLWWVKHALVELQTNPFHTDLLFFPQGTDLYLSGVTWSNGVLSIPLQLATGNLILSWNVLSLLFFVLSGLGMYALSYRVTRNHGAALISGYIFAFSPFILMKYVGISMPFLTTWPIPLFVLFLLRFQETGRLREAVGAGISWAILIYTNLEYAAAAGILLGLFLAYWSFVYLRRREWLRLPALWRGIAVTTGVWLLASLPLLIPTLQSIYGGEYSLSGQGDEYFSADLLGFVTPSPLWGSGIVPEFTRPDKSPIGAWETTVFLGTLPLMLASLALFAIRRSPHRVVFWAMVFLFFATLALGPYLYVGNTKSLSLLGASFTVPLPYQIYDQLPLVSVGRVPARLIVFGLVGLAVLAGTGFDVLTSWLKPKHKMLAPLAALLVLSLVALEYWNPPIHLSQITAPAIFEDIRDEPGDFSVLHAPWGRLTGTTGVGHQTGGPITMYYQRIHEKASFGGYIARPPESAFAIGPLGEEPGLGYLSCGSCPGPRPQDLNVDEARRVFRKYEVKYVMLHRGDPNESGIGVPIENLQAMDAYLLDVMGLTPVFSDSVLTVYRNQEIE